jgi:hypothetical protein
MTALSLSDMVATQDELLSALDAMDVERIARATAVLAAACQALKDDAIPPGKEQLAHALKQSEAARIRVNCLLAWNRQKIDRLAELRGANRPAGYGLRS